MAKSEFAKALDGLQSGLLSVLKGHGFLARGGTFNRRKADGLVDVVNLRMGMSDPPGTEPIPAVLERRFTVDLGIYVPEVESLLHPVQHHDFAEPRGAPLEPCTLPPVVPEAPRQLRRPLRHPAAATGV